MLAWLVFVGTSLAAPVEASAPIQLESPPPTDPAEPSEPLVLDVAGLDQARLVDELRLRRPRHAVWVAPAASPPGGPVVVVVVRREEGHLRVSLILPNGDAHDRTTPEVEGQSERVVASLVANLLDSIAGGSLRPTRTKVAAPTPSPATAPRPAPAPAPPTSVPAPAPPPRPPAVSTRAAARLELAPVLAPTVLLSLAPRTGAGVLAAGGGSLGLDLRHVSGALVALDVRALGRVQEPLVLARLRVGIGAGYAWRRKAFELPVVLALSVEPWWITREGAPPDLERDGVGVERRPLWGALARVAPGVWVRGSRPEGPALRLGARLDVAGSFVYDAGARSIHITLAERDGTRRDVLQLGGLELGLGIEAALWFGASRRPTIATR